LYRYDAASDLDDVNSQVGLYTLRIQLSHALEIAWFHSTLEPL
jgi:hypothetical protein